MIIKEKNLPSETQIQALSHEGRGIALINNKTTFIEGALPGETVTYQITQKHSNYQEAKLIEVINASSERVKAPCPHFNLCGGCSLQHMIVTTQIAFKQQTVLDQLKHIAHVIPKEILPPLSAETTGYRRKARLGVKFVIKKNKLLVGFREKSSRYLADLEKCVVLYPAIGEHFQALRELVSSLEIYQQIPQIEIAVGDSDAALVFRHLAPISLSDQEKLINFGKQHSFHIYLQPNSPEKISKIWPADNIERLSYSLPDHHINFLFHPLDFTQINLQVNRLMVNQAIELLELNENDSVLDLFCGIGNFTLPIARRVKQIVGIEGSEEMVARAKENALHNNLHHPEFYAANLDKSQTNPAWTNRKYDKILLDPPRAGAKEMLTDIEKFSAKRILYVSCHSATFARDAAILTQQFNYQLTKLGIINMFPHTSHIETMAVFER